MSRWIVCNIYGYCSLAVLVFILFIFVVHVKGLVIIQGFIQLIFLDNIQISLVIPILIFRIRTARCPKIAWRLSQSIVCRIWIEVLLDVGPQLFLLVLLLLFLY